MSQTNQRVGIYAGSFDPPTLGHFDIIERARAKLVDKLIVVVAHNINKSSLFTVQERVDLVRKQLGKDKIEVCALDGLLVDFANKVRADVIVRGLRAVSDFDYEFQMAGMNAKLDSNIETVFLMAKENYQFISSRMVKEIAMLGGNVDVFVGSDIGSAIRSKLNNDC